MKDRYTFRIIVHFIISPILIPILHHSGKEERRHLLLGSRLLLSTNMCACIPLLRFLLDCSQASGHQLTVHQPERALHISRVLRGLTMAFSHPTAQVLPALQEPTNTFMPNPESHGRKKRTIPRTQLSLSLPLSFLHRQDASGWPTTEFQHCARQQRTLLH